MKSFMEVLSENIRNAPERAAFRGGLETVSFGRLDEDSGRVRAWLKEKGVGREDMVLIRLPRGVKPLVCAVGVWKAGAALTITEDDYAPERIEWIRKDAGCRLVIDAGAYDEMMRTEPLPGYEKTDPHDACFAVYTSGTTGRPKGVLHEYGKLDQAARSISVAFAAVSPESVFALISPLNFVASVIAFTATLYFAKCLEIIPYELVKNPARFFEYLAREKTDGVFLPPVYASMYRDISPALRVLAVGSDRCGGLFIEGPAMINCYASSEAGMNIAVFPMERAYENTPAGKNPIGLELMILDENGNRLKDGETGEICFVNEFTRGYINLPDLTARAFAGGLYHTGDLGSFNENGDLVVRGRADDMIKINGNRIEPAEIEAALKETLGVGSAAVKGFIEKDRAFLCAYLLRGEIAERGLPDPGDGLLRMPAKLESRLRKRLPDYMIPTRVIVLDRFPLNANGKLDRKRLKAPAAEPDGNAYEAPENETEQKLCELFAEALKRGRVGVNDDFYLSGGDSMAAMRFISGAGDFELTIRDLYEQRTPKKLAALIESRRPEGARNLEERNTEALASPLPLTTKMKYMLFVQEADLTSTVWNLPALMRVSGDIGAERLAAAADRVLRHHPALRTVLFRDGSGETWQRYAPEAYPPTEILEIPESRLWEFVDKMSKPFRIFNGPLVRDAVIRTENAVYLYLEIYHLLTDGSSFSLLLRQISRCARDPSAALPPDHYYLLTRELTESMAGAEYRDTLARYRGLYQKMTEGGDFALLPATDHESDRMTGGWARKTFAIDKGFNGNEDVRRLGGNVFFLAVFALTAAKFNGKRNAFVQWIHNSRDSVAKVNTVGLLIKSVPLFSIPRDDETVEAYYEDIRSQIDFGIAHNHVQFDSEAADSRFESIFIYQKDMFNLYRIDGFEEMIPVEKENNTADSLFEFDLFDESDAKYFGAEIEYSADHYDAASVERFLTLFDWIARKLLRVTDPANTRLTDLLMPRRFSHLRPDV